MDKFQTKKSLGQHFLNSPAVPSWMCEAAELQEGDMVLEIGPGTGALTREILARGAKVVALETDQRAITVLEETFNEAIESGQLRLIDTDVRKMDLKELNLSDHDFKVIANIPYYLTGHLFRVFLESPIQPNILVFLVQKEVGKRATSKAKESLLSLSLKAFGEPVYIKTVGKGHFTPAPQIDSAIVLVKNINRDNFVGLNQAFFFDLLHLGFGQKRKQLLGNLSKQYAREDLVAIFQKLDLKHDIRAEDLPLNKWLELAKVLG